MEILVLDIETTGFYTKTDAILEIGMVLINTQSKEIETVFNHTVLDEAFKTWKHKKSWVFENSSLTMGDILRSFPLEHYREEIQELLNKYPVTAYNKPFDLRFMKAKGFEFKDTKCILKACRPYWKAAGKTKKTPSFEDMHRLLFEDEGYIEEHRGGADALDEAKLLLKLCEIKEKRKKDTLKLV